MHLSNIYVVFILGTLSTEAVGQKNTHNFHEDTVAPSQNHTGVIIYQVHVNVGSFITEHLESAQFACEHWTKIAK